MTRRDIIVLGALLAFVLWMLPGCAESEIAPPAPSCAALECVKVHDCEDTDPGGAVRACACACALADGSAVWCAE